MPSLNEQINRLVLWLKTNPTEPPIREYTLTAALPHSAYPSLAVLPLRVRFTPNSECASASVVLRLACCTGRPVDSVSQVQDLAEQLKARLETSQNLGGLARHAAVGEVTVGTRLAASGGAALRGREQIGRQARGPAPPGMAATEGRPTRASPVPTTEPPLVQYAELELRLLFNT